MVVIEGLRNGPVEGECRLTLYAEGGVIQHFKGKSVILGKWKALEPHGRLIDADKLRTAIEDEIEATAKNGVSVDGAELWKILNRNLEFSPTVLEASNKTETPRKAHICPHYQGVCGLDEDILCYCSSAYEMCDTYKEANE